jgi:pyridoxamine 5'-phosphate oxidase
MEKSIIEIIRKEYLNSSLDIESVHPNPVEQFRIWLQDAIGAGIEEPTAMLLATTGNNLQPSARMVLLKGVDENGFDFYTNYESHKGRQIAENPKVAAAFFWKELERQVRIEGEVEKLSAENSDEYFRSRPFESRLSSVVSPQSNVISSRVYLENLKDKLKEKYRGNEVPRPTHWGGYKIRPQLIEFWQGRENRLHDRLQYNFMSGKWLIERLAP